MYLIHNIVYLYFYIYKIVLHIINVIITTYNYTYYISIIVERITICAAAIIGFWKKYVNEQWNINMMRKWAGLSPVQVRVNTACLKNRDGPGSSGLLSANSLCLITVHGSKNLLYLE